MSHQITKQATGAGADGSILMDQDLLQRLVVLYRNQKSIDKSSSHLTMNLIDIRIYV